MPEKNFWAGHTMQSPNRAIKSGTGCPVVSGGGRVWVRGRYSQRAPLAPSQHEISSPSPGVQGSLCISPQSSFSVTLFAINQINLMLLLFICTLWQWWWRQYCLLFVGHQEFRRWVDIVSHLISPKLCLQSMTVFLSHWGAQATWGRESEMNTRPYRKHHAHHTGKELSILCHSALGVNMTARKRGVDNWPGGHLHMPLGSHDEQEEAANFVGKRI